MSSVSAGREGAGAAHVPQVPNTDRLRSVGLEALLDPRTVGIARRVRATTTARDLFELTVRGNSG